MVLSKKLIRVLLLAEACNPEWTSVPLVGWSLASALKRSSALQVDVVTQIRNRDAISRAGWQEHDDFEVVDTEWLAAPAYKLATFLRGGDNKGWTTVTAIQSLTYPIFERQIWHRFGPRIRSGDFDVVHRITPLSPTANSFLAKKCHRHGVPFVLGPLNGGVPWPKFFSDRQKKGKEWLSHVRRVYRLLPGHRQTLRLTKAIIVGSRDTWAELPERVLGKCVYIPENGIDPARFSKTRDRKADLPLRLIFVGRLVPYKGADMVLDGAAELLRTNKAVLTIIGTGPELQELKRRAKELGVEDRVNFMGQMPHDQVQDELAKSDLFVFPSIREFGGAVALEAMAVGLTPLVVGYGGLADLVNDKTGFLIPIGPRDEIVRNLDSKLKEFVDDPRLIDIRSSAAQQRAIQLFTWDQKSRQITEVYNWLLGRREEKPNWGMPFD